MYEVTPHFPIGFVLKMLQASITVSLNTEPGRAPMWAVFKHWFIRSIRVCQVRVYLQNSKNLNFFMRIKVELLLRCFPPNQIYYGNLLFQEFPKEGFVP